MATDIDIRASRQMSAPADAIWNVMCDLHRLPEWLQFAAAVEDVSGSADSVGATYKVKPPQFYEPKTSWRVAEAEPRRRQLHTSEMPIIKGVTSTLELAESDGKTVASVHWKGTPAGFGRLMRSYMQKRIRQNWERSLEQLDELAARSS